LPDNIVQDGKGGQSFFADDRVVFSEKNFQLVVLRLVRHGSDFFIFDGQFRLREGSSDLFAAAGYFNIYDYHLFILMTTIEAFRVCPVKHFLYLTESFISTILAIFIF
jgi:hypothetical protein